MIVHQRETKERKRKYHFLNRNDKFKCSLNWTNLFLFKWSQCISFFVYQWLCLFIF